MGPIGVTAAAQAARELSWAIYMAARAVDEKRIAELRSAVVSALTSAGLLPSGDAILISPGQDLRISISLKVDAANPNDGLSDLGHEDRRCPHRYRAASRGAVRASEQGHG
jgi:hypothetical protein